MLLWDFFFSEAHFRKVAATTITACTLIVNVSKKCLTILWFSCGGTGFRPYHHHATPPHNIHTSIHRQRNQPTSRPTYQPTIPFQYIHTKNYKHNNKFCVCVVSKLLGCVLICKFVVFGHGLDLGWMMAAAVAWLNKRFWCMEEGWVGWLVGWFGFGGGLWCRGMVCFYSYSSFFIFFFVSCFLLSLLFMLHFILALGGGNVRSETTMYVVDWHFCCCRFLLLYMFILGLALLLFLLLDMTSNEYRNL